MMTDIIASGAIHSLKSFFIKKKEKNTIIDPFSCLVKLSLLKFLDKGTKISVYQNRICFNSPTYIQGMVRFIYGDGREDLHNIFQPIQKCVEWFWDEKNDDIIYMFNNAVNGLKILKCSYSTYATIQHTIDYYIIILMQKNNDLISKLGINILDINKITDVVCNKKPEDELVHQTQLTPLISLISLLPIQAQQTQQSQNHNTKHLKKHNNHNANSQSNSQSNSQAQSAIDDSQEKQSDKSQDIIQPEVKKHQNTEPAEHLDIFNATDVHKFLFELWNDREIKIVINLFKELEAKQHTYEKDYIYSNLMQYCEMKENKLFKYIEEHSSIL